MNLFMSEKCVGYFKFIYWCKFFQFVSITNSSNFTICTQNSVNRNISNPCIIISGNDNVIVFTYFVYLILEGFMEFFCLFCFPFFGGIDS